MRSGFLAGDPAVPVLVEHPERFPLVLWRKLLGGPGGRRRQKRERGDQRRQFHAQGTRKRDALQKQRHGALAGRGGGKSYRPRSSLHAGYGPPLARLVASTSAMARRAPSMRLSTVLYGRIRRLYQRPSRSRTSSSFVASVSTTCWIMPGRSGTTSLGLRSANGRPMSVAIRFSRPPASGVKRSTRRSRSSITTATLTLLSRLFRSSFTFARSTLRVCSSSLSVVSSSFADCSSSFAV